jgi:peptidyl-prolyl cis-trans isomerase B (cyclophilin B)
MKSTRGNFVPLLATAVLLLGAPGALAEESPEKAAAAAPSNPVVKIKTSMGEITAELDAKNAPVSTANFVEYARAGYYDGTVFHRVIPNFMIQGGGMDANLAPKAGARAPIQNEADNGLKNTRGTLAMARTSDPNSATSQFFINVTDNGFLDHRSKVPSQYGYAVFGKVTEGMDVVDRIKAVKTGSKNMMQDVPVDPVVIESVTVVAAP